MNTTIQDVVDRNRLNDDVKLRQMVTNAGLAATNHRVRYEGAGVILEARSKVLDLGCGCGYGAWLMAAIRPEAFVVGVDFSEIAIDWAKTHFIRNNVTYLCEDVTEVNFEPETFDVVTCFEVLEHVVDSSKLLERIKSVLKPNGVAMISTPNGELVKHEDYSTYHVRHYSSQEFTKVLASAGLRVEHLLYQHVTGYMVPKFGVTLLAYCSTGRLH